MVVYHWASQSCAGCGHLWESEVRVENPTSLPSVDATCPKCGQSPAIVLSEISGVSRGDAPLNGVSR